MLGNLHEKASIKCAQPAIMLLSRICALAAKGISSPSLFLGSLGLLLLAASFSALAQSSDPGQALEQRLTQTFTATVVSPNRQYIVTPGSILVLQKDGMMMCSVDSPLPPSNSYKNGKISQGMAGSGRKFGISTMSGGGWPGGSSPTGANYPQRSFGTGEKLWVSKMTVQKHAISFVLYSEPGANNIRYYGELKFPFGKGPTPSPSDALKTIGEVFTVEPTEQQVPQAAQSGPAAVPVAAAPLAEPAMAPIAPPPPPPTVSIGDTKDQVVAALGKPDKVEHLGAKEIDHYKDMKVTLVNGKVTDVQ